VSLDNDVMTTSNYSLCLTKFNLIRKLRYGDKKPICFFLGRRAWPSTLSTTGFSRVRREFSVLTEGRHIFGRTETGNRARKVSGTQGIGRVVSTQIYLFDIKSIRDSGLVIVN